MKATIYINGSSYNINDIIDDEVEDLRILANRSHKNAVTLVLPSQYLIVAAGTPWHVLVSK